MHPDPPPKLVSGLRRAVFVLAGLFFVGLATLGVFLPVLPTTPFLLLASYFLVRSSPGLHAWLLRNRVFGPFLRDWQKHRGVRRWVKVTAVGLLLLVLGSSMALLEMTLPVLVAVGLVGLIGLIVVLRLPVIVEASADALMNDPGLATPPDRAESIAASSRTDGKGGPP
jgi:uncharacterized membrane protein YbaN (DUF454 family)